MLRLLFGQNLMNFLPILHPSKFFLDAIIISVDTFTILENVLLRYFDLT